MRLPRSPTAAILELESSAPPMDLDRPQGSSAQPLDLPHPSSTPSRTPPGAASPLSLAELAQSSETALNVGTESANADSAAEAEPAVAAESALQSDSANDASSSVNIPSAVDKPVQHKADDKPQMVVSPLEDPTQTVAGNISGVTAVMPTEQSGHAAVVQGKIQVQGRGDRQVVEGEGQGEGQVVGGGGGDKRQVVGEGGFDTEGSQKEEEVPCTEEDLDSAMQELAQEVRYTLNSTIKWQHHIKCVASLFTACLVWLMMWSKMSTLLTLLHEAAPRRQLNNR